LSTWVSLYCFHAKQIGKDLNEFESKENSLCPLATTEPYPKETKKRKSAMTKARLGLMPVFLSLSNHADPYFSD